jgi:hypothetical protein
VLKCFLNQSNIASCQKVNTETVVFTQHMQTMGTVRANTAFALMEGNNVCVQSIRFSGGHVLHMW